MRVGGIASETLNQVYSGRAAFTRAYPRWRPHVLIWNPGTGAVSAVARAALGIHVRGQDCT